MAPLTHSHNICVYMLLNTQYHVVFNVSCGSFALVKIYLDILVEMYLNPRKSLLT